MTSQRYKDRGVSSQKEEVHAALPEGEEGLFPRAFCKIVEDSLGGDTGKCMVMHADGAGTKSSLAYLAYRESGDPSVFRGLAQDALVMNIDDMLCVGALGPFMVSNTIGRNARLVPGEVIREIMAGYRDQAEQFGSWGMEVCLTGGETADVGDIVRTLIVDATVVARMERERVIGNDRVKPGDIIIGLASFGQACYEKTYNSGIGSNGLTSARHDLLAGQYAAKYPESFEPGMPENLAYSGTFKLEDSLDGTPLTIGEALLSPTRSYAPLIKKLLEEHREKISALVHCTGGGQTKCLRAGEGIQYIKDNIFTPPPLFLAIREASGASWRELYQVFNMGHRMEVIGDKALLPVVIELGAEYNMEVKQIGHCQASPITPKNQVAIHTPGGVESYQLPE